MNLNVAQVQAIFDGVETKCRQNGYLARVNMHEPKTAPGSDISCAVWLDYFGPSPLDSGLASTTGVLKFMIRLYTPMLGEPMDAIDPQMMAASVELIAGFSGDFDLGGAIRNVDIMGAAGQGSLSGQAGYLVQDAKALRIITITLPLIVNDMWDQVA